MGVAILGGILASLAELQGPKPLQTPTSGGTPSEELPPRLPSRFIACVRSHEGVKRVKSTLWEHSSVLNVVRNQNLSAVHQADVILLACQPGVVTDLLSEPGMAKALHGKLLISVCAGITVEHIEKSIYGAVQCKDPELDGRCRVVRAMCNTAALIRESMTVIAESEPPLPRQTETLVTWIFKRVGDVVYLPADTMDASTALCGSGPSFFAVMLEAAIEGAVAMGLPRQEATRMAAQTMRGTTGLVQNGTNPAIVRQEICTPGGCTIGGTLILEEAAIRGTISRAVREAAGIASQLGKGVRDVNSTRHL